MPLSKAPTAVLPTTTFPLHPMASLPPSNSVPPCGVPPVSGPPAHGPSLTPCVQTHTTTWTTYSFCGTPFGHHHAAPDCGGFWSHSRPEELRGATGYLLAAKDAMKLTYVSIAAGLRREEDCAAKL